MSTKELWKLGGLASFFLDPYACPACSRSLADQEGAKDSDAHPEDPCRSGRRPGPRSAAYRSPMLRVQPDSEAGAGLCHRNISLADGKVLSRLLIMENLVESHIRASRAGYEYDDLQADVVQARATQGRHMNSPGEDTPTSQGQLKHIERRGPTLPQAPN